MKKIIASVVLAAMLCAALFTVAGAKGKGPMVVTTQSAYIEEGYEGDVWNGVCENVIRRRNIKISMVHQRRRHLWSYRKHRDHPCFR